MTTDSVLSQPRMLRVAVPVASERPVMIGVRVKVVTARHEPDSF